MCVQPSPLRHLTNSRFLCGCFSYAHVQNKRGSSFSWQNSLASDVCWSRLDEILQMTEQEVYLLGGATHSSLFQHVACKGKAKVSMSQSCTTGRQQDVTVQHRRLQSMEGRFLCPFPGATTDGINCFLSCPLC
jgi:hypothetical protein